ncbi:H/ACA ribonucleoprotein complex non-core subunit NAF1-like [Tropilaelaps mercedesae]|uniref:H/ACA ribonucleoprotein complex non-core subunit NAF1 n=1 Tax=Tropilaelaps mercedesae TaxID=418985 RepID=A0A1V9XIZ0_9ACAR|nr:H/ACA ribonucleoprotein complex non-core subunit NAF1-like [Tropilaelaps mercedesae]
MPSPNVAEAVEMNPQDESDNKESLTSLKYFTATILESPNLLTAYREKDEIADSDSDESDIVVEPAPQEEEIVEDAKTKKFGHTVKGELTLDELPPVEKLQITVPQDHLRHVGDLYSFVDCLVVVESTGDHPVLNLESVLFLEDGRAIGAIFDVIGPVKKPYYVLRFNNPQEIADEHLEKGTKIFYADGYEQMTFFVFEKQIRELTQMKGSDASWEHDLEPPEHELDYSNDEEERAAKQERRTKRCLNGQLIERKTANTAQRNDSNNANNSNRNRRRVRAELSDPVDTLYTPARQLRPPANAHSWPTRNVHTHPFRAERRRFTDFKRPVLPLQHEYNPWALNQPNYMSPMWPTPPQMAPPPPGYSPGPGTAFPVGYPAVPFLAQQFSPGALMGGQPAPAMFLSHPPTSSDLVQMQAGRLHWGNLFE